MNEIKDQGWLALLALTIARSVSTETYDTVLASLRDDGDGDGDDDGDDQD